MSVAASGSALLALLALCFWLTSLDFGNFRPENPTITFVLWVMSTCVVIGTIAVGFLLFRYLIKLYIERRQNQLGSHIKTKLVTGVLVLCMVPITLHVIFSISLLNRNLDKWFSQPTVQMLESTQAIMEETSSVLIQRIQHDAAWIATQPETTSTLSIGNATDAMREIAQQIQAEYIVLTPSGAAAPIIILESNKPTTEIITHIPSRNSTENSSGIAGDWVYSTTPVTSEQGALGNLTLAWRLPETIQSEYTFMQSFIQQWQVLEGARPVIWRSYVNLLALITLFMLFIAVWLAQFASKQIIRPIEALVTATDELAGGRLDYRVKTPATDELAGLVKSFNQMSQTLESKTGQLEKSNAELAVANSELKQHRRFINAILESISPGVVSVTEKGEILKFNESAQKLMAPKGFSVVQTITELLSGDDQAAFDQLFKRARRTGTANREFKVQRQERILHLNITVSLLKSVDKVYGFVVVFEDMTELMQGQRSAAWQEVARRLAHEIKNPLTPIALATGRIDRLLERYEEVETEEERTSLQENLKQSTSTIIREVHSLKTLVNNFSDLARFPTIRPESINLNNVVLDAVSVFEGRLPGIKLIVETDPDIPLAHIDPEPFKRVIVNLIDNAAAVVQNSWVKEIVVSTAARSGARNIELTVADSGPGISPENKAKLFLPYFSTKERGTGLGLTIVRGIVQDHKGSIRVEDNQPSGSRFIIEIPVATGKPAELQGVHA